MKIGEFLIQKKYITPRDLEAALSMQKDNPGVILGDILVTMGIFTKDELIKYMEHYIMETGVTPLRANEWLSQEEIDHIQEKYGHLFAK